MKNVWSLLLITTLSGCFARDPEITGKEGKPMPIFPLLLADSTTYFTTRSIPAGKPYVLFYFGAHCGYSHAQMEEIIAKMNKLKDIHFYMITASPFNEMKEFYDQYALNKYPNITVGRDYTEFFGNYYEARGVPFMAFYKKDKVMHNAFIGKLTAGEIKDDIE